MDLKILYVSTHSIHEYDEIKLLMEVGADVGSIGSYSHLKGDGMRPELPGDPHGVITHILDTHSFKGGEASPWTSGGAPRELVEPYDVVMVMHNPEWIKNNWETIKDKTVIWRCNGQSNEGVESKMAPFRREGMKIVRYSPYESHIPNYIGHDEVIRFGKDPEEWKGWTGGKQRVITFAQSMAVRGDTCGYRHFLEGTEGFDRQIFGQGNEAAGAINGGWVPFDQLKEEMRTNAAYFYTGTWPACYTLNFIEAWMTGIPIVALGEKGNGPGSKTYEITNLIEPSVSGYIADDPMVQKDIIRGLMGCDDNVRQLSREGRRAAIKHFGKDKIKAEWERYLKTL